MVVTQGLIPLKMLAYPLVAKMSLEKIALKLALPISHEQRVKVCFSLLNHSKNEKTSSIKLFRNLFIFHYQ